jgi:lipopolysaccharide/colanic/teichoic acid biosynthesis glycosyltransferase
MENPEQVIVITPMASLYETITGKVPVEHVGDDWSVALPLERPEASGLYPLFRRGVEVAVAAFGLVALGVALPALVPLVIAGSPGPVFYRQLRVGRGGRPFVLVKLRTMHPDAEAGGPVWAAPDDARATPGGRWLRRTRVDELPQLLNVLRGEMALIGPRPERPEFVDALAETIPFYRARHAVRPGITGWAAVRMGYGGSPAEALEKLQYDLYYIKHQGPMLDLTIALRTLGGMIRLRGR